MNIIPEKLVQDDSSTDSQREQFGPSLFSCVGLFLLVLDLLPFILWKVGYRLFASYLFIALFIANPVLMLNICWANIDDKKIEISSLGTKKTVYFDEIRKVILKSDYKWVYRGSFISNILIIFECEIKRAEFSTWSWTADVEDGLLALLTEKGIEKGFKLERDGLC